MWMEYFITFGTIASLAVLAYGAWLVFNLLSTSDEEHASQGAPAPEPAQKLTYPLNEQRASLR